MLVGTGEGGGWVPFPFLDPNNPATGSCSPVVVAAGWTPFSELALDAA